jgi:tetratricopeptide (TPR) repeat protein
MDEAAPNLFGPSASAAACLERARACRDRGEYDRAIEELTEAVRLDPAGTEAFQLRAQVHADREDYDRAIADFTEALQRDFHRALSTVSRVLACTTQKHFAQAIAGAGRSLRLNQQLAEFARALALEPGNPCAGAQRELAQRLQADYHRAVADLQRFAQDFRTALGRLGEAVPPTPVLNGSTELVPPPLAPPSPAPAPAASSGLEPSRGPEPEKARRLSGKNPSLALQACEGLNPSLALQAAEGLNPSLALQAAEGLNPSLALQAAEGPGDAHKPEAQAKDALSRTDFKPPTAAPEPVPARPDLSPPAPQRPAVEPGLAPTADETGRKRGRKKRATGKKGKKRRKASRRAAGAEQEASRPAPRIPPENKALSREGESRPAVAGKPSGAGQPTALDLPAPTQVEVPRVPVAVGSLRLECPQCGAPGRVQAGSLGKVLICKVCSCWLRMDNAGRLSRVEPAGASRAGSKVPPGSRGTGNPAGPAPGKSRPEGKPSAVESRPRPTPPPSGNRKRLAFAPTPWSEGRLAALLGSRVRRWTLYAALLALAGLAFGPSFGSSELRARGEKAARAWLHKDYEEVQKFLEPNHDGALGLWLARNAPPDLEGQDPTVTVSVERLDSQTADVLVQVKAGDKDGGPARYVFRHRWVEKDGTWYFRPLGGLATPATAAPAATGGKSKTKTGAPGHRK